MRCTLYMFISLLLTACGGGGGGGTTTHFVTGDAGSGGTIFPSDVTVDDGDMASFTVSANAGFEINTVSGCGGNLVGNSYITDAITSDCTVTASFSLTSSGGVPATPALPVLNFTAVKNFHFSWVDVADATHYKLLENPNGISGFSQAGGDIAQGVQSIDHIVPLFKRLNASYILQSCNASGCTDSTTLSASASLLSAIGYFKASNTEVDDAFGVSVELSGDGDTLAVGAIFEDSDATGINGNEGNENLLWNENYNSGAVYVFTRDGADWTQQAYVKASNTDVGDRFGWAISLNENGNTMAVGAYAEHSDADGIDGDQNDETAIESGAVYVFTRSGNDWSQLAYIKASNSGTQDRFGYALSLNDDGNTLAVGAYAERSDAEGINGDQNNDLASASGAVYVFTRTGVSWVQQAYVKASNTGSGDNFGWDVSLSGDGNTLAVGANNEASMAAGINGDQLDNSTPGAGAVYVFTRSGTAWSQQAYLKDSRLGWNISFGHSLSLSGDGATLAVGATGEDSNAIGINNDENNNLATDSGAVYVFTRSSGNWSQQAYVKASNTDASDQFGFTVSLSNGGNTLAVGAPGEASNTTVMNGDETDDSAILSGAAYLFVRSGGITSGASWQQQTYIKASNSGVLDSFGGSVDLSNDGTSLAVSSSSEDSDATGVDGDQGNNAILGSGSGAVYLY